MNVLIGERIQELITTCFVYGLLILLRDFDSCFSRLRRCVYPYKKKKNAHNADLPAPNVSFLFLVLYFFEFEKKKILRREREFFIIHTIF